MQEVSLLHNKKEEGAAEEILQSLSGGLERVENSWRQEVGSSFSLGRVWWKQEEEGHRDSISLVVGPEKGARSR